MPFGVVAGGIAAGGSILNGILGSHAAKSAASAETNALQQGVNFQNQVYNTGQSNLNPYITGGQSALSSLLGFYGLPGGNANGAAQAFQQFTNTPSYQFPLQQGNLALNRQLASAGLIGSGAALKDATQYNQGYASQGLGQYLTGLAGLSTGGQGAAGTLLSGGNQAATTLGNLYGNQGAAQAGGIVGSYNALSQGLANAAPYLTGLGQSAYNGIGGLFNNTGGIAQAVNNWTSGFGVPGGNSNYGGILNGTVAPAGGLT